MPNDSPYASTFPPGPLQVLYLDLTHVFKEMDETTRATFVKRVAQLCNGGIQLVYYAVAMGNTRNQYIKRLLKESFPYHERMTPLLLRMPGDVPLANTEWKESIIQITARAFFPEDARISVMDCDASFLRSLWERSASCHRPIDVGNSLDALAQENTVLRTILDRDPIAYGDQQEQTYQELLLRKTEE